MRSLLAADHIPGYLSAAAAALLGEARAAYARYQLADRSILQAGPHTLLLPWASSRAATTLTAQLSAAGLDASNDGLVINVASVAADRVREYLQVIVAAGPVDSAALAATVANKASAKYDEWIDDDLLAVDYARRALDTDGAWRAARTLSAGGVGLAEVHREVAGGLTDCAVPAAEFGSGGCEFVGVMVSRSG